MLKKAEQLEAERIALEQEALKEQQRSKRNTVCDANPIPDKDDIKDSISSINGYSYKDT